MDKPSAIQSFKDQLQSQHQRALAAVASAAEGATGDDAKAESKYDTRGLESSYLAAGQAEVADEIARIIGVVERYEFRDFSETDPIDIGALVCIDFEGDQDWYLIAPGGGGGLECTASDGDVATILGPKSPLTQRLSEKKSGETLENSEMKIVEVR